MQQQTIVRITTALAALAVVSANIYPGMQGDVTFYDPMGNYGACGARLQQEDPIAALSFGDIDRFGFTGCLEVTGPVGYVVVKVMDKCEGCKSGDVDLTRTMFGYVANEADGRRPASSRWVDCARVGEYGRDGTVSGVRAMSPDVATNNCINGGIKYFDGTVDAATPAPPRRVGQDPADSVPTPAPRQEAPVPAPTVGTSAPAPVVSPAAADDSDFKTVVHTTDVDGGKSPVKTTSVTSSLGTASSLGSCSKASPCANPDHCCSKWGYCGSGPNYCGEGCQDGACGSKKVVKMQGACSSQSECPTGQCCSKFGYCGSGPGYCDAKSHL